MVATEPKYLFIGGRSHHPAAMSLTLIKAGLQYNIHVN